MDAIIKLLKAPWFPAVTGVVGYVGGFVSDLGKEHLRRRMRLQEEHAHEIQKAVLTPLYNYLNSFYLPACSAQIGFLDISTESVKRAPKDITDDGVEAYRFRIGPKTPVDLNPQEVPGYSYWRESETFRRFFDDAKEHHHPELLARWVSFRNDFEAMCDEAVKAAEVISRELRPVLNLPAREAGTGLEPQVWADYEALAVFLVHRQSGVDFPALYVNNACIKVTGVQQTLVKCASAEEATSLLLVIDKFTKDVSRVGSIRSQCGRLRVSAAALIGEFRFEISKKPELKGCPFI